MNTRLAVTLTIAFILLWTAVAYPLAVLLRQREVSLDEIKKWPVYNKEFIAVKVVNSDSDRQEDSVLDDVFLLLGAYYKITTGGPYTSMALGDRKMTMRDIVDRYAKKTEKILGVTEPTIKEISIKDYTIGYIFQGGRVEGADLWLDNEDIFIQVNYKPVEAELSGDE